MIENKQSAATNSGPGATHATAAGLDSLATSAHSGIDAAAKAVHRAVNSADKAGLKGEQLYTAGTGYMREHPVFTLGAAVAAGYVLSRLLATR
jgi:ElaB/YqjD/DUF883 family membrane-anchored ribosome-binding protein